MKLHRQPQFDLDYQKLPVKIKTKLHRQLKAISENLRHPSLRTKKIQGHSDIWEARIDRFYRFTFKIINDIVFLRRAGKHDEALKSP